MKSPSICVWYDLQLADIETLNSLHEMADIKRFLQKKFKFEENGVVLKDKILIDLYYYTYIFCRDHKFMSEQTSAFFSIVKRTHEKVIETPYGNVEDAFSFFQDSLLCHSVKRPPFSIEIFNVEEVKDITHYVVDTYFRHYKLYKYAFTPKVTMNICIDYEGMKEEPKPADEPEEQETEAVEPMEEVVTVENPVAEQVEDATEPEAVKELKSIITTALEEQVQKLKVGVDNQLRSNEETLMKRVSALKGTASPQKSPKGGRKK